VEGCATGEDMIHRFRVAAVNDVGMGPYSLPVTFTQRKAGTYVERTCPPFFFYQPAAHTVHSQLVLRFTLCFLHLFFFIYLCIPTYHMHNNYVTYIVVV